MRVWQKVYLATLVIFLSMLNIGLLVAANYIFEHNVEIEKLQGERECYFLVQNLEHDFSILEKNGRMQEAVVQAVVAGYQNYYQSQEIFIQLKGTLTQEASIRSLVVQGGRHIYIQVERTLAAPYSGYTLFYQKELVDFEETWYRLQTTFVLISVVLSFLLCIILFFMMQRIFKPLERLNESVAEISKGNYDQHLKSRGSDEIAELAENINVMADTIQTQISVLEDENAKKQQLMDNLAHELRTPLTSIYGYAELLQRARMSEEEVFESLSYIIRESKRLNKMSDEMLSMRLLERENVVYTRLSITDIAGHVRKLLKEKLEAKEITLLEQHEQESVMGEEYLYIMLFRNLLENAIRASYNGGVIEWRSYEDEFDYRFEIIDYGIGMAPEELSRIMDAFYRVDKGRARAEGGAGLGLSIVNIIVTKLNGKVQFDSEKGQGTKVTVLMKKEAVEQD